jgi:hypothetical protein
MIAALLPFGQPCTSLAHECENTISVTSQVIDFNDLSLSCFAYDTARDYAQNMILFHKIMAQKLTINELQI